MTAPSASTDDGLPTAGQALLLRAALGDGPDAAAAWRTWSAGREPGDDVDPGSQRLLPLVRHNLRTAGAAEADDPELRQAWLRAAVNRKVIETWAVPTLRGLVEDGFDPVVLKGLALGDAYYPQPFLRPMGDVDVLVPRARAAEALAWLEARGWHRVGYFVLADLRYRHSGGLRDGADHEIDLHWSPLLEVLEAEVVDGFERRCVTVDVAGLAVRRLSPTDELIQALVHGLRWEPVPPIRWVPDSIMIMRASGEAIDWDRLIRFAARESLAFRLHKGLRHLADAFGAPVPARVLEALGATPVHWLERHEGRHSASLRIVPSSLVGYWRHRRSLGADERRSALTSYLAYFLRVERRAALPGVASRWLGRRLAARLRGGPRPRPDA